MKNLILALSFLVCPYTFAQEAEPRENVRELMGRSNYFSLQVSSATTTVEDENTGALMLTSMYGRNFGHVAPFFGSAYSSSDSSAAETSIYQVYAGSQFSFVRNEPGQDIVPYVSLALGYRSEVLTSDALNLTASGTLLMYSVGVMWYPFSEIAALTIAYGASNGTMNADTGSDNLSLDYGFSGLNVGWTIFFDN